jgi:cytochrome oxidase Cu insertion factor (SCO1/SenC/PrrC family)
MKFTLIICGVVMAMGLVVFSNYRKTLREQANNVERLPVMAQMDKPLDGINHRGEEVSFEDLRGKVWVLAYADITSSPAGTEPLILRLKALQDEFADDKNFHVVALSTQPGKDTPGEMLQWGKQRGLGEGNWWFMTGVSKEIRTYIGKYFKLYVTPRTDPQEIDAYGPWETDFRLSLVDQAGAVRAQYEVLDARVGERHSEQLRIDIKNLLEHGPNFGGPGRKS